MNKPTFNFISEKYYDYLIDAFNKRYMIEVYAGSSQGSGSYHKDKDDISELKAEIINNDAEGFWFIDYVVSDEPMILEEYNSF